MDRETAPGRWHVVGGAVLLLGVIAGMALLVEHDAASQAPTADTTIAELLKRHGYLVGFLLVYIEESGVPLFISGDAFLLYIGHRLSHNVPALVTAWLGMILAVVLGASIDVGGGGLQNRVELRKSGTAGSAEQRPHVAVGGNRSKPPPPGRFLE